MTTTTGAPGSGLRERVWLVAHDFSPHADAAADQALAELRQSRAPAQIILFYAEKVLAPPAANGITMALSGGMATMMPGREPSTRKAERRLAAFAEALRARAGWIAIDWEVRRGPAVEAILACARARNADRIVVGTHGRRGASRLLLGSVAESVLRTAPIPVLVVHAPH